MVHGVDKAKTSKRPLDLQSKVSEIMGTTTPFPHSFKH